MPPPIDAEPKAARGSSRSRLEWLEIAVLVLVLIGLILLFGVGLARAAGGNVTQCATAVPADSPIGPVLAIIALTGIAIGRGVANARKWIHEAPPVTDSKVVRTDAWLQGSLALFLILAALLLGYETYGVAHFADAPPITEYVRCAAGTQPWPAALGTFAISILLGNWLWYPTR